MTNNPLLKQAGQIRKLLELLGPPIAFRKMFGILNALEMQVEDGKYQRHAVARLCEALLATAQFYDIPEDMAGRLEELACGMIDLVEKHR